MAVCKKTIGGAVRNRVLAILAVAVCGTGIFAAEIETACKVSHPPDASGWFDLRSVEKDDALIVLAKQLKPCCCSSSLNESCTKLHWVETELRRRLLDHMAKEKKAQEVTVKQFDADSVEEKVDQAKDVISEAAKRTEAIKKILAVLPHRPDPIGGDSFYDHERRVAQFYAGVETVPDKLSEASPLVGLLLQTRFLEWQPECRQGWHFYGVQNGLRAQLGSSRERPSR